LGEKGSEKLSIAPNPSTRHCSTKHLPGETVVKNELGSKWSGYFKGVKGSFAFFESSDSMNGAFGFSVVDTTIGATMFADDASFKEGFSKVEIADSNLKIEYQRSLSLGCSLMTDPNSCWQKIASATGLAGARRPDCAPSYARFYPAEAEVNAAGGRPEQIQAIDKVPSVITYNARARVGKKLESLAPLPGFVSCAVAE